jgi:hypothetical protein
MSSYRIVVVDNQEEWTKLGPFWNDVLLRSRSYCVFLTYEWLSSWMECYLNEPRRLFVLVLYADDKIVGMAPWYRGIRRIFGLEQSCIEFLGTPEAGADYLDVISLVGYESRVADAIFEYLMEGAKLPWSILCLNDVRAESFFFLEFMRRIAETGKFCDVSRGSVCPTLSIPPNTKDCFSLLSAHRRGHVRRYLKLLEQSGTIKHISQSICEDPGAIESFISFYEEKKEYKDPRLMKFMRVFAHNCCDKNTFFLDTITVGGNMVASILHFAWDGKLMLYNIVTDKDFDPKVSIGDSAISLVLQKNIPNGLAVYDFLKGAENYKLRWANGLNSSLNLLFAQRRPLAVAYVSTQILRKAAKIIFR